MKKIFLICGFLMSLVSCSSINTNDQGGAVSIRTSPSTAIVKFTNSQLNKGDMVSLFKSTWIRKGKTTTQTENLVMNGVVEKTLENNYYEIKFERNEEFSEGDKVKKILK